ncbi:NTP transferase domain-containing protein [Ruminococcaceae bacterium OttesenSCG-928-A16]|nr:NTP transferase domain-containing protein [Ruminococcaceae bacterium OttesenSCG-928-A16]
MRKTAVIMAGGKGERFWPQSRSSMPKQFLSLTGDGKTMIQLTVERLSGLVLPEDIYIVTNEDYRSIALAQLPGLPPQNILCEPAPRNTAPCIAFAAAVITARYGNAVMVVLPADHIIKNTALFTDTFTMAAKAAEKEETLLTVGVAPTYPETGYGYIKINTSKQGEGELSHSLFAVEKFVEKPDYETAKQYFDDGNYLWNSGMFVWKASSYYANLQRLLPDVFAMAKQIEAAVDTPNFEEVLQQAYHSSPSVSVDYGIMEKAQQVYMVPASFGWDDVGSWLSLERINPQDASQNVAKGNVVQVGCENSIFVSEKRLVAAVGVQNIIVVATDDAVLVCDKDNAQDVKKIVELLKQNKMDAYL